jgi:hypothetical protein
MTASALARVVVAVPGTVLGLGNHSVRLEATNAAKRHASGRLM